jgi:glucose/arabinose dehydrogenase
MTSTASRRTFLAATAAAGAVALTGPAGPAEAAPAVGRTLARGLRVPWGLAFLPNGDALVAERVTGRVHRVSRHGGRRLVGRVPGVVNAGEGGLLGLAVAPTFAQDRWLYAYLSTASDNRIVRMRYTARGRLGRPQVLLAGIPVAGHHNGGRLRFSPGGRLYAGTGDAGRPGAAQDPGSLAGKILRINPDGSVPAGNPFGTAVWSYGHRNVQGLAFDGRGRLWATELGQSRRDEMNRIRPGGNYGWPRVEGGDGSGPFRDPFVVWPTSRCSPSGIATAAGYAYVGALRGRALWRVRLNGPNARRKVRFLHTRLGRIRTVERAPDGSLWVTTSNRDGRGDPVRGDDRVIRIRL